MEIILDEKIQEYVKDNNIKRIVLNNRNLKVWGKQKPLPVVSLKDPDPHRGYNLFILDGDIEVYIDETIPLDKEKIVINYRDLSDS